VNVSRSFSCFKKFALIGDTPHASHAVEAPEQFLYVVLCCFGLPRWWISHGLGGVLECVELSLAQLFKGESCQVVRNVVAI
jgi:hypothetical protein